MMPAWWLSKGAERLRAEINTLFPVRDKKSDGSKGDAAHAARQSDHNPDPVTGVVRAIDVDEDVWGKDGADPAMANLLVARLIQLAKKDKRFKYIIFEGSIWSKTYLWAKRPYKGSNPHNHHIHISFSNSADHDGSPFGLVKALKDEVAAAKPAVKKGK